MTGEFGGAAVALLLLSFVSRARFESAALLPLSLVARRSGGAPPPVLGLKGATRQRGWRQGRQGRGAPPPLLGQDGAAIPRRRSGHGAGGTAIQEGTAIPRRRSGHSADGPTPSAAPATGTTARHPPAPGPPPSAAASTRPTAQPSPCAAPATRLTARPSPSAARADGHHEHDRGTHLQKKTDKDEGV